MEEIVRGSCKRWAIFIDIQGFGALWDKNDSALIAISELMRAIFQIGNAVFPESPNRLFAHQFGDGFLIASEYEEDSLERCVSIAIALLRHVSATGCFAKASIVEGDMLDIKGYYPSEVMGNLRDGSFLDLGTGLMTITPVMGTALIRGVKLDKNSPQGPLLVTGKEKVDHLPQGLITREVNESAVAIDWMDYESDLLFDIQQRADLKSPSKIEMQKLLWEYCAEHEKIPREWVENANKYQSSKGMSK